MLNESSAETCGALIAFREALGDLAEALCDNKLHHQLTHSNHNDVKR